jgi:hypothetical protein
MEALLIRKPWIDKILDGSKTWEIRGRRSHKRGLIGLVESGSGTVIGTAKLTGVVAPLALPQLISNASKAGLTRGEARQGLPYKDTFAWIIEDARRLVAPVPYRHPPGAVIWVRLSDDLERAILRRHRTHV